MGSKVFDAPAKLNIFLKLIGRREDGYHLIASRFVRLEEISDKLWFDGAGARGFEVVGDFNCPQENNTISRALAALGKFFPSRKLFEFAASHKVVVYKKIPSGAGLGGASSDAATFLKMINSEAKLGLSIEDLSKVGVTVGADIPFFLSGHKAANVGGIGEKIEPFDEDLPKFSVKTPPIVCETPRVYQAFRQHFSDQFEASAAAAERLLAMSSREILRESSEPEELNDLLAPALKRYPELIEYKEEGWFLSGSGSAFFRGEI